jgi:hypothetical protein
MTTSRTEALATARKLCRTLMSAPSPQARARELFHLLSRAQGWKAPEALAIAEFGAWLEERPAPGGLKGRCEQLLSQL